MFPSLIAEVNRTLREFNFSVFISLRLLNDSENNWASTNSVYLPRNMKIGEWVNVSIPLQRFAMYDVVDYSNIKFVEIKRNGFSEKKLQQIAIIVQKIYII